ncbi:hypothetical protein [Streptomyces sp. DH12]|uniref:hypothetical protein n=1 Tax=Streptomyces sp. DH12 TaxID=2857010 RepID=UPI001E51E48A|nr:hypothetical protein [Streptomyces sp. DH12]
MTGAQRISDAAEPIADALTAVQQLDVNVPPADILISYTTGGLIVRVADRGAPHRDAVENVFRDAFLAAGWGVVTRNAGGLSMEHPSTLTRL